MPITPEFSQAYNRLNLGQKQAVDTIDGPVMVVAGPGTGKTQILALRIANILLRTDTSPDSILALTFTESGVYSMRKRLVSIIGNTAYKINIYTFHGFCNDIIKNYPEEFSRIIGSNNATEIDQIRILEDIIENSSDLDYLKPYGDVFYYLRPVLGIIRNLKREDVSPEEFKKIVKAQEKDFQAIPDLYHEKGAHKGKMKGEHADLQKKIEKNRELAGLYEKYEAALQKNKLYDFEDMIVEAVKTLKEKPDLLLRLQEKYQYILADEHQDANRSQNEILELLSNFHDNPNIFVVGDEKQAIFRFQGASLENFLYFKKLYPNASIISLEENYRSTQNILDLSHGLISGNKVDDENLRKKLVAKAEHAKKADPQAISLYEFTEYDCELQFVVRDIEQKLKDGVSSSEIAVIYRDNRDAQPLMRAFEKAGVPFTLQSDQDIFSDDDVRKLIILFRTASDLGRDELLIQLLYVDFLGLEPLDVYKLAACAAKKKMSLYEAYRSEECMADAKIETPEKFLNLAKQLSSWATVIKNKGILEAFEIILHESGFLKHLLALPDASEKMAKLDMVFAEAKKIAETNKAAGLGDLLSYIDILKKYNILVKTGVVGEDRQSVRLMTAHKSKGLEFEHVYIIGMYDGHWGNKREIRHFHIPLKGLQSVGIDPMEDERRLMYVALTRARRHITVTYSLKGPNGENILPSQFISELDPALVEKINTEEIEKKLREFPAQKYEPAKKKAVPLKNREFLKNLFLEQGLSVTALNKFMNCPWDYFFNNLLRMPQAETKHQLYGTAIHATLREFFSAYAREEDISKAELLKLFENHLSRMYLSKQDFAESLEKGKTALSGYLDAYKNSWPRALLTEYAIKNVEFPVEIDGKTETVKLRGQLDKIELLNGNEVNVVDFKTAKPKSRNAIMGLTKTENGEYFRQLCFYRLLLEGGNEKKYVMNSAEIDFIEPDEKGKYHKEKFEISDDDLKVLRENIEKTAKEICSLEFWDSKCDEKECQWCGMRKLIT